MNFEIKEATLHPQFNIEKNFHAYMTQLFSLCVLKTIKDYNRLQREEVDDAEKEFRVIINGGIALKSYFPTAKDFVTTDYDLFMFAPKYYEKNQKNLEAYSAKQKEIALMFMENCTECFHNLVKQGVFKKISDKEVLVNGFPTVKAVLILKDGEPFFSPFLKNFKPSPKEPLHVEIDYAYVIYKNNEVLFSRDEALVEVINFLNDEDITAQEPDFSPAALKKFYGEKYRKKPVDKSGFFMNFKHPAGRKGFYKQYVYSVCIEDDIYVASLGYLIWDSINALNRYFDAVSNIQGRPHNYDSIVGTLFHDTKFPYDGKNPNSSNKFKYERYLMKFNAIIKLLSDPRYLNSYTLEGFMERHKKVIEKQGVDGCPLEIYQNGVKRRGFSDKKEELVEIIMKSGIFPPIGNVRKILMDFSFDTLCSHVRDSILIEDNE